MIDFQGQTLSGNAFDSRALRGKYVLLDFWGSWCGPCRLSNPHLKVLYEKYRSKGFEIVGIAHERRSLEKSRISWENAVKADGLPWIQLLHEALVKDQNLLEAYNLTAYPTKILIDQQGRILWRETGGNAGKLTRILEKIFAEKS